jgi:hypothetical protein
MAYLGQVPVETINSLLLRKFSGCVPHERNTVSADRRFAVIIPGSLLWPVDNIDYRLIRRRSRACDMLNV